MSSATAIKLKSLLCRYSPVFDFLSASLIISLCFILLLPKVHESFQHSPNYDSPLPLSPNNLTEDDYGQKEGLEHNHHHHGALPIGELLICTGFFVFYCIGLALTKTSYKGERQPLLVATRTYTNYTEELKVTRRHVADQSSETFDIPTQEDRNSNWPLSARVFLFALLLALSLIMFDLNISGLMEAVKVFRAAATGALLYLAFFLILPKFPDCNACLKPVSPVNDFAQASEEHNQQTSSRLA